MTSKEALENISWRYVMDPTFQEWCNIVQQDLERLEKLEKDLNYISNQDFQIYEFPNGRIIFGVDITNCPNQQQRVKRILESILKEVLEND